MADLNIGTSSTNVAIKQHGNIIPQTNTTYDLGFMNASSSLFWNRLYVAKTIFTTASYGSTLPTSGMVTGQVFFKLL